VIVLRPRVIPALLLRDQSLVKTVQFGRFDYIGDPTNTVRIFNELEVDELAFLDITATVDEREPNLDLLADIANECFMPLSYGGGVRTFEQARAILGIGYEKVIVNTHAAEDPGFVTRLADHFGSQAVIASIDVRRDGAGRPSVWIRSGSQDTARDPVDWARDLERRGAGEILLTSIDREGTWSGYDIDLIRAVTDAVGIPLIAHGGAGSVDDVEEAIQDGGASAAAVGSMVVYQRKGMGVLVNFPPTDRLTFDSLAESTPA
jgi:imidazole glycerol-phosphate synthase subunit HisF